VTILNKERQLSEPILSLQRIWLNDVYYLLHSLISERKRTILAECISCHWASAMSLASAKERLIQQRGT